MQKLPDCPVETTLGLISNRWKVLIIRDLLEGKKRFGELKQSIGNVSQKVLTSNLRDMEKAGLLTRTVYPEVPPKVEYELTELGLSLSPVLDSMIVWGTKYKELNQLTHLLLSPIQIKEILAVPSGHFAPGGFFIVQASAKAFPS